MHLEVGECSKNCYKQHLILEPTNKIANNVDKAGSYLIQVQVTIKYDILGVQLFAFALHFGESTANFQRHVLQGANSHTIMFNTMQFLHVNQIPLLRIDGEIACLDVQNLIYQCDSLF